MEDTNENCASSNWCPWQHAETTTKLEGIGIETRIMDLQKSTIVYSAKILRTVFEVRGDLLSPNLKKTFAKYFSMY